MQTLLLLETRTRLSEIAIWDHVHTYAPFDFLLKQVPSWACDSKSSSTFSLCQDAVWGVWEARNRRAPSDSLPWRGMHSITLMDSKITSMLIFADEPNKRIYLFLLSDTTPPPLFFLFSTPSVFQWLHITLQRALKMNQDSFSCHETKASFFFMNDLL